MQSVRIYYIENGERTMNFKTEKKNQGRKEQIEVGSMQSFRRWYITGETSYIRIHTSDARFFFL
jgi:hypothetical protein